jgi:hypothetical protein
MTKHLKVTTQPRAIRAASRPSPDLRGVDCWSPVVVGHNGNGRGPRESSVPRRVVRLVNSLARVVLGLPFFATRG